jgi:hypothetical protein
MSLPCAVFEETIVQTYTTHRGTTQTYNYVKLSIANGNEYNKEKRIDLTGQACWIIKRENS